MVAELHDLIGANCVFNDALKREAYGRDESGLFFDPELVVEPDTIEQIQQLMAWATRHRIAVTPRAAASNVTGGALAVKGGVILSLMRLNQIIAIDKRTMTAVVQPGVITYELQSAAREQRLYYPPDPSSVESSTIGGNIAEDAGGAHCLKYGTTKDYVLALTVVLPDGALLKTGTKTRKGVVGYDLTELFSGSEGTLGVIVEATLMLIPQPREEITLLAVFDDTVKAMDAAAAILESGVMPSCLDMMRGGALLPADMPIKQKAANVLLIELDGHPAAVEDERDSVGEICLDRGALDVLVVTSESKRKDLWDKRRRSWTDLVEQTAYVSSLDPCVPLDKMAQFVGRVEEIKSQYGLTVYFSGHVGDGNLHVNFAADTDTPEIRRDIETASGKILKLALSLGGTISGEHGIGYIKKKYVPLELSAVSLAIQKKIKQVLDPLNIMNPEKIFPGSLAAGLKADM